MLEFYGEGVHRFFAGDLVGAEEILTRVIDSGSQDARAYYFRGLVREQQGGGGEFDFETGARLELESKRSVNVGLALTRIQGHVRGKIEKARREARAMVAQQRMMMQQSRMEAAGNPGVPVPESLPVAPDTGDADMFDEGLRSDDTTLDAVQPVAPEVDATDPFSDEAPAADPAPTTEEPSTVDPFESDAVDPFNSDAPAADDNPFSF